MNKALFIGVIAMMLAVSACGLKRNLSLPKDTASSGSGATMSSGATQSSGGAYPKQVPAGIIYPVMPANPAVR